MSSPREVFIGSLNVRVSERETVALLYSEFAVDGFETVTELKEGPFVSVIVRGVVLPMADSIPSLLIAVTTNLTLSPPVISELVI